MPKRIVQLLSREGDDGSSSGWSGAAEQVVPDEDASLQPRENASINAACAALNDMERTQLMQEAVIHETARLGGVRWSADPAPPLDAALPTCPTARREGMSAA